jgi:hypothetical protein
MKKYLVTLITILLISPIIVSAAWWNPLSWFNSWSFVSGNNEDKIEEMELLEEKIKELESKIDNQQEQNESTEDETEELVVDPKPEVVEKIVYVEKPVYVEEKKDVETKQVVGEEKVDEKVVEPESDVKIAYSYISQSTYEGSYGDYGSVLLGLRIATDKDIYIPQRTTDTSGSHEIGFYYTIKGDFVGHRTSEIDCTLRSKGYCKIKGGSTDKEITVNVWFYPEDPGEYTVEFTKLGYKYDPDGVMNYITVDKIGDPLYVGY